MKPFNSKAPLSIRVQQRNDALKFFCEELAPVALELMKELYADYMAGKKVTKAGASLAKVYKDKADKVLEPLRLSAPKNVRFYLNVEGSGSGSFYSESIHLKGDYTVMCDTYADGGHSVSYKNFPYVGCYFTNSHSEILEKFELPVYEPITEKEIGTAQAEIRALEEKLREVESDINHLKRVVSEV